MGVKHAVITSVDRDDLLDGGSIGHKQSEPSVTRAQGRRSKFDPGFRGEMGNLQRIIQVAPEVVSHNLGAFVRRLTKGCASKPNTTDHWKC